MTVHNLWGGGCGGLKTFEGRARRDAHRQQATGYSCCSDR